MVSLLDVNVLISLAWPSHVHHDVAHNWFAGNSVNGWATCPLTQCAFLRISSNPKIIPEAVSVQETLKVLEGFAKETHHVFWPDDLTVVESGFPSSLLLGHRQVADAYLLGLAIQNKGKLVTLDQDISALLPTKSPHRDALRVIPC